MRRAHLRVDDKHGQSEAGERWSGEWQTPTCESRAREVHAGTTDTDEWDAAWSCMQEESRVPRLQHS
jgi:hypothetical protein